ncbi:MAG TPA: HD domain-containing phosphohydrolase [Urbifossiella sp.]|jgi:putative two-component system response regulator|nr:HD domain-containing phosphohydrolase [Urbifossiella sp.]
MRVLIADDNHFYRCALAATLKEWGYEVVAVADGEAAWEVLRADDAPKIAVLDWMMPRLDGVEVCRRLRAMPRHEPTYIIILTSRDGKANAVRALESGADDYVTKPFDRGELAARLRVGRRIVSLQTSETIAFAFARAVDGKCPYTRGHSERVTRYALALAARLELPPADTDLLRRGATLHDIGKIAVPDAVLNKTGPLTPEERALIREHPAQGVQMLGSLQSVADTIPLVRWHHERMDGTGYPDGLPGDRIPLLVRVLSVADVYDALRSDRPYRAALPHDVCLAILRKDAVGGGLDADLVEEFCAIPGEQIVGIGSGGAVRSPEQTPPPSQLPGRGSLAPA